MDDIPAETREDDPIQFCAIIFRDTILDTGVEDHSAEQARRIFLCILDMNHFRENFIDLMKFIKREPGSQLFDLNSIMPEQ